LLLVTIFWRDRCPDPRYVVKEETKPRKKQFGALTLVLIIQLVSAGSLIMPAFAQTKKYEDEYARGVAAYLKRDYKTAGDLFWQSITDGNPSAVVWLYKAHSDAGMGNVEEAHKKYESVVSIFKGTEEAKVAAAYIKLLDSKRWNPAPAKPTTPDTKVVATATSVSAQAPAPPKPVTPPPVAGSPNAANLISRIVVIPPTGNHVKVSGPTVATVKAAIEALPRPILKTLDEGGVKINIGPNIIDKWPDSIKIPKPPETELTLAEEPGRTYGRDIYIYERAVVAPGVTALGDARSQTDIRSNFLHEVGHALDDCTGVYSKNSDLQRQYHMDCDAMTEENKAFLCYFLQVGDGGPAEACAETVMVLLGGTHNYTDLFNKCFPRTRLWVKSKLSL